jgi:O-antigen/teichoic acid export membrane protein
MTKKSFFGELGKGTLVLLITMNIYNVLNFLFHFAMGRMLGPEGYGILAVLMSLVYVYSIPTEAIQNLITKLTSKFNAKDQSGKIKYLLKKSLRKTVSISGLMFIVLTIISIPLAFYLRISFWLVFITNILIFISFASPIARGVLQGRKKFGALGGNMIIESVLKLFFAISFVFIGFKVFGAVVGVVLGSLAGLVFALYFNKDILRKNEEETKFDGIYLQSIPYFITMGIVLLGFSLDILLAKRFFAPDIAGQYAVLSMLGKIIFFGTSAINKAMFPLTSEKGENHENTLGLFKKSLAIITFICFVAVSFYYFLPELIIKILYGSQYLAMAPYLVYSGIALSLLSLSNLVFIYGLSTNRLRNSGFLVIFLIIEVVLLSLFHGSVLEFVLALMFSNTIMFICSFLFVKFK